MHINAAYMRDKILRRRAPKPPEEEQASHHPLERDNLREHLLYALNRFKPSIPESATVVDLACGDGELGEKFLELIWIPGTPLRYIAVDHDPARFQNVRTRLGSWEWVKVSTICARPDAVPLRLRADVVLGHHVLHEAPDPHAAMERLLEIAPVAIVVHRGEKGLHELRNHKVLRSFALPHTPSTYMDLMKGFTFEQKYVCKRWVVESEIDLAPCLHPNDPVGRLLIERALGRPYQDLSHNERSRVHSAFRTMEPTWKSEEAIVAVMARPQIEEI